MYTYKNGTTALHLGGGNGHKDVVGVLVEAGADINSKTNVRQCKHLYNLYIQTNYNLNIHYNNNWYINMML